MTEEYKDALKGLTEIVKLLTYHLERKTSGIDAVDLGWLRYKLENLFIDIDSFEVRKPIRRQM
jgi:hypothetical protein